MTDRPPSLARVAGLLLLTCTPGCGLVQGPLGEGAPLAIQRFIAVPAEVAPGSPTLLSWDVEGAESVEVDNGIGLVPANGSRTVRPMVTTTYRLVAVAGTSLATASIRVVVAPSPSPSPTPSPPPS
jgi:hypothetical protein